MKLVLCPRCELNYILETEKYCKVCQREMHGMDIREEVELCSICNEMPVLPGRDVCAICLKEMSGQTPRDSDADIDSNVDTEEIAGMDSVAQMDEIIPEMEDASMRHGELGEMTNSLSLESVREDEQKQQDEEDMEDDEDQ